MWFGLFMGARSGTSGAISNTEVATTSDASAADGASRLINPTVIEGAKKHFIINFQPLRFELEKIQKKYPQHTYIYFNYLNNASWIGLNERDNFVAASLVKVPLSMAVYKAVENGKLSLDQKYILQDFDLDSGFGDLYKVGAGKSYSVGQLLEIMLEKSDNTAASALQSVLRGIGISDPLTPVYESFGWALDFGAQANFAEINVKTLSTMFLALYNAQYLNVEDSEKVLEYLDNSDFNDKIPAGVPESISVAHKIGVASDAETFSDCGIVYAPNRNYLLCLGSNGGNEDVATQFMAEISKATYQYVINN